MCQAQAVVLLGCQCVGGAEKHPSKGKGAMDSHAGAAGVGKGGDVREKMCVPETRRRGGSV